MMMILMVADGGRGLGGVCGGGGESTGGVFADASIRVPAGLNFRA
jgi:hypothetical protein